MKKIRMILTALCLVAAIAACGSETTSTDKQESSTATATGSAEATSAPAAPSAATITIANMGFGEPVTVPPGAQIAVKNDDGVEHSVTSQTDGQFDVHVDGGVQKMLTAPTTPGEYAFYCVYHPSMKGTLIVK
jgi:plastocyanin